MARMLKRGLFGLTKFIVEDQYEDIDSDDDDYGGETDDDDMDEDMFPILGKRKREDEGEIDVNKMQKTEHIPDPPDPPVEPPEDPTANANFRFYFFKMGQGDCTLIQLPNKKWMVIDGGTSADEENYSLSSLAKIGTLVKDKTIEYLIVTHPDYDHYNRLSYFFKGISNTPVRGNTVNNLKLKLNHLYCSFASNTANPMANYVQKTNFGAEVKAKKIANLIHEVNINEDDATDCYIKTWKKSKNYTNPIMEYLTAFPYTFIEGDAGGGWSVSFLAGNVGVPNDRKRGNGHMNNTVSIATLFQIGGQKVLMRGDATDDTDDFVLQTSPQLASNLTFCSMAHHGAQIRHCNIAANIALFNPDRSLVSTRTKHKLPELQPIMEYINCATTPNVVTTHRITGWIRRTIKDIQTGMTTAQSIVNMWDTMGIPYETQIVDEDTYYVRTDNPPAVVGQQLPIITTKTSYVQMLMAVTQNVFSTYDLGENQGYKYMVFPTVSFYPT